MYKQLRSVCMGSSFWDRNSVERVRKFGSSGSGSISGSISTMTSTGRDDTMLTDIIMILLVASGDSKYQPYNIEKLTGGKEGNEEEKEDENEMVFETPR